MKNKLYGHLFNEYCCRESMLFNRSDDMPMLRYSRDHEILDRGVTQ